MNVYDNIFKFKGSWRSYQERVLKHADTYLQDGKIHIVAAPGSGKTTLGIELIRRLGCPALILSPRLVIREQWLERIREAFLTEDAEHGNILSNDLKSPGLVTSITYQTLYSGMNRYKGELQEEDTAGGSQSVDFSGFDLLEAVRTAGIRVICLDECHHLRSEWWAALEHFMHEMENAGVKVISLTATPPYDSTPSQWERYIQLCGPIDEEIIVPELVREGSLCPHQDYVYFNFPTGEEEEKVRDFRNQAESLLQSLMADREFLNIMASHQKMLDYDTYAETMLEEPPYVSAMLIFYTAARIPFDTRWKKLLGVRNFPEMDVHWMEILLQKLLFDDKDSFVCDAYYRETLTKQLKKQQFLVRQRVGLVFNSGIQKLLTNSLGKLESIKAVVKTEFRSMKSELRMLILTDYIRKEFKTIIGNPDAEVKSIGVVPIFEMLRREVAPDCRLGVLCGSMIILPVTALPCLEALLRGSTENCSMSAREFADREGNPTGYAQIDISGRTSDTTKWITQVFEAGYVQVLIGTKSLLGEGWDSPGINSLILASFVGSYILSNQMRGRAIRVMQGNPEKTSNIWHLVCIENQKEVRAMRRLGCDEEMLSEDFATLRRRMKGFIGVSYDGTSIEGGMERLDIIQGPFDRKRVLVINQKMEELAGNREGLRQKWNDAILMYDGMEVMDEVEVEQGRLKTKAVFFNIMGLVFLDVASMVIIQGIHIWGESAGKKDVFSLLLYLAAMLFLSIGMIFLVWKGIKYLTPLRYLQLIGNGVLKSLEYKGLILSAARVEASDLNGAFYEVYLKGGSVREKDIFSNCVEEFFGVVDNQRYLLYRRHAGVGMMKYFCVPEIFAKSREDALLFSECMKKTMGSYKLIYTRNPEGRKILIQARAHAYANRADWEVQRLVTGRKRKVKSRLE